LDRDPNIVYITLARYEGVSYPSDSPFQLQDQPTAQADIGVFDATPSDDGLQFESLNLLVMSADQGIVQCMEMGAVLNSADRTFVTADPQDQALARALKFPLPTGAMNVQMQTGFNNQDVIPGVGGVQVTSPVPPGRHQFALSFQLPYAGTSQVDLSLQMPYQTAAYTVYVPQGGIKLEGSPLDFGTPAQLGGQTYAQYSATGLAKSTMVSGQLSGLGAAGGLGPTQLALISLGAVLLVIGGGVVVLGGQAASAAGLNRSLPDLEHERLELVVRLAALDERFAAGEVGQTEYAAERDRGKQRLRELTLARLQSSVKV
jgi:hypothetical protein